MNIKQIIFVFTTLTIVQWSKAQDLDDAKLLIENERYSSAEALLEKNIGNAEPDPEMSYLLIKTYLEQEKAEEASRFVNKHLQSALSDKIDPLNRIAAARYLLNVGNKKAAGDIFQSILANKKNQKKYPLLVAMAEVNLDEKEGNVKASLTWLDMAEKRNRYNSEIDILRGLAYWRLDDASNAYLSYQKAIQKDPTNTRAYYLIGKIFTAQKNPEVYMKNFMKAYEIDSTYAPVLEELYKHYYFRDVRQARIYLEKFIANTDHTIKNDYYWTDILYLTGDYLHAIASANKIFESEKDKTQPRLYKLIAYSYAKSGDSVKALQYINQYMNKENPAKKIAADFQLIAELTARNAGREKLAIQYYTIAVEMDTIISRKADYAAAIASLYKKLNDPGNQTIWLGKVYQWKEKKSNLDLFSWGLAAYMANDYRLTDSVFSMYTNHYPEDIYGYYWRAQANAAIDSSMTDSLAIPHYYKVVEIGEKNKEANRKMLSKAYGYLGAYEVNIRKDYVTALSWFERYDQLDKGNADVTKYIEMLHKWINEQRE